jgi:hypothetical protein
MATAMPTVADNSLLLPTHASLEGVFVVRRTLPSCLLCKSAF